MRSYKFPVVCFIFLAVCLRALPASAALVVSWRFDTPDITAQPSDRIPLYATIFNSIESDQVFSPGPLYSWGYTGTVLPYYLRSVVYEYNMPSEWDQLANLVLAPGEEFHFLLAALVPNNGIVSGGSVPYGIYASMDKFNLGFTGMSPLYASNTIKVTVAPPSVPVPASAWLLISALLPLGAAARNKIRAAH